MKPSPKYSRSSRSPYGDAPQARYTSSMIWLIWVSAVMQAPYSAAQYSFVRSWQLRISAMVNMVLAL